MSKEQSESKSEKDCEKHCLIMRLDKLAGECKKCMEDKFHIIPKSDDPAKHVEIIPDESEDTEYTFLNTKLKLKWKTQEGGK